MSKKLYEENDVKSIADAIRTKNNSLNKYTINQMAAAILAIDTSYQTIYTGSTDPSSTLGVDGDLYIKI